MYFILNFWKVIPIKYLYDKIVNNRSKALVYMLESDILYMVENGIIVDKIIITEEQEDKEEKEVKEDLF